MNREDGKTGRQGAFERLNTDYTDKKRITRIRARPAQKTEKCKTEKWESFNRQDTRAPGSHQGSILFQFVGRRNKLEQNGTLKPLAALLVCGVHSQSDGSNRPWPPLSHAQAPGQAPGSGCGQVSRRNRDLSSSAIVIQRRHDNEDSKHCGTG